MNCNNHNATAHMVTGERLQTMFPRASKSFLKVNRAISESPKCKVDSIDKKKTTKRVMNKTEAEYALILESMKQRGEIRSYMFQPFSLPWADMKYTPDFMVTPNSGSEKRRMIEVKGPHIHYRQQAIARFKGARSYWPEFQFEIHQKTKNGWKQLKT